MYACCSCNWKKGNDWPSSNPIEEGKGYLDPCIHDFNDFFFIDDNGHITAIEPVAKYMIERLNLNRNFLIKLRNERREIGEIISVYEEIKELTVKLIQRKEGEVKEYLILFLRLIEEHLASKVAESRKRKIPPYEPADV